MIIFAFVSVICGLIHINFQFVFVGVCNVGGRGTRTVAARTIERKRKATAHVDEARVKIGKYASINGTASARSHFQKKII